MTDAESTPALSPGERIALEAEIDAWAAEQVETNPVVLAVERSPEPDLCRWYVRIQGDDKPVYAVWFTLNQRTLHYETYFLPAPPHDAEAVYANLLARNRKLYGLAFAIGDEDALYLQGRLAAIRVTPAELDRVLGTIYATVEQAFRPALRLAFGVDRMPAPDEPAAE